MSDIQTCTLCEHKRTNLGFWFCKHPKRPDHPVLLTTYQAERGGYAPGWCPFRNKDRKFDGADDELTIHIDTSQAKAEAHADWFLETVRPLLITFFEHGYKHGREE